MKDKFPGYFPLDEKHLKMLWKKSIFSVDANVLLNLYRYSQETRDELLEILNVTQVKNRLWISNQATLEFLENRLSVINEQIEAYEEMILSFQRIKTTLEDKRKHPFLNDVNSKKLHTALEETEKELKESKEFYEKLITSDHILEKVTSLLVGRVGNEYSEEEITKVCEEGEIRYEKKIPPGYKDEDKGGTRKFGDLLVWMQLMDQSKDSGLAVIFITDDKKEDWWLRFKGKTISARPQLIKEFKLNTGKDFVLYQVDRFMEAAISNLGLKIEIPSKSIEEIRERRYRLRERPLFPLDFQLSMDAKTNELRSHLIQVQIGRLHRERRDLRSRLEDLLVRSRHRGLDVSDSEDMHIIRTQIRRVTSLLIEKEQEMGEIREGKLNENTQKDPGIIEEI